MAWESQASLFGLRFSTQVMIKLNILTMNTRVTEVWIVTVKWKEVQCVLEGGLGFLNYWLNGPYGILNDTTDNEWEICTILHNILTVFLEPTSISQFSSLNLHSSIFLKVCSPGAGTPLHPVGWRKAEFMWLHLVDAHFMTKRNQTMLFPRWLIQLCWSLVWAESVELQCTCLCVHWQCPTVNQLNRSLIVIHLSRIDCLVVCPASCLLVCVAQLLTCNLHCYNVYWLCIRGWLIQSLHHFISLIPRPFSCPALIVGCDRLNGMKAPLQYWCIQ